MSYYAEQKKAFERVENAVKKGKAEGSVVDPVQDYVQDKRLSLTSLSFLPPAVQQKIYHTLIIPLQVVDSQQAYFEARSLHVTVQNIRTVADPPLYTSADIEKAREIFHNIVPKYPLLKCRLEGLNIFPASVAIRAFVSEEFRDLVLELREALRRNGVPDNKVYASGNVIFGNVTFVRFTTTPNKDFFAKVEELKECSFGEVHLEKVSLMEVNALCHPSSMRVIDTYSFQK
ncbi:MAG: hypothetical protein H6760_00575 [Candidatus Nomurabacteria bacterium]|nr:MAG: hypothetical protein H6760_00575 [Candidatus Nomurabacteria bacterium]